MHLAYRVLEPSRTIPHPRKKSLQAATKILRTQRACRDLRQRRLVVQEVPTIESKQHPDQRMDAAGDRTGGQVGLASTGELPREGVERKLNRPQKILRKLSPKSF